MGQHCFQCVDQIAFAAVDAAAAAVVVVFVVVVVVIVEAEQGEGYEGVVGC